MIRWSAIALIVLCVLHMIVLGSDVPSEAPRWLALNLWTFEHWMPARSQATDLALSNGIFWATIGSFALPGLLFGALLLHADRRGWVVPPYIGWGLFAWALLASLIMAPSGFPVLAVVMLFLAIGLQRRARRAGHD